MLSERKAAILQAVVEGYITTSEPIGSAQVGRQSNLEVSGATIRSEMVALEEEGYLTQPHTSAGRIPSDKGYRYFVDTLMTPYTVEQSRSARVVDFFAAAQGELERLLRDTSSFLTQLTDYTAVVVGPEPAASPMRGLQVVRLSSDQAMAVVVHANAAIERVMIPISEDLDDGDLEQAAAAVRGTWLREVAGERPAPTPTGMHAVDAIATRIHQSVAVAAEAGRRPGEVYVDGTSTVAGLFDAVEQVKSVLAVLEKQYTVVTLVKDILDRGLNVAIGSETGLEPLADCSLVVAPIQVEGRKAGTIGVLGPTRMRYSEAMATVALVSREMSRRLAEGS